ncbi:MAG: T9SS type A sorting domain-containing protein [Saprospiraceae bacterium]|nr:T9SS type A sorting domain-containing protein [Saprospiraceae bacterium]
MKYIFTLLYICSTLVFNLTAQQDWIGNYSVNKDLFISSQDTVKISVDIYINGLTQSDTVRDDIECSIFLNAPWSKTENGLTRNEFEFEMQFEKRIEDKHRFSILIPVPTIKNGRYNYDFKVSLKNKDTFITLKAKDNPGMHFSVGNSGFISIFSRLTTNDNINNYTVFAFEKEMSFIPDHLEGIYSNGFCIDEYISIDEFNFMVWNTLPENEIKIETFYSIDGGKFSKSDKFKITDDSKDGNLIFLDKTYDYLNNNSEVTDYCINLETEIEDLLRMIQGNIEFNHKIEFFFKINGADSEYRFPENDNLVINFKVANSPTGADCQAALLPIDLLNWDALKKEKIVYLKWTTASETNNDYFEIERSTDVINWRAILKIQGHGDSKEIHNYNVVDNYPLEGDNYYRLKQTDFDGTHKYSRVKIIKNYDNELILYPNPVEDILSYKVTDPSKQFSLEIINSSGKIVETHKIPDNSFFDNQLNISHLDKGVYLLKYINTQNHQAKVYKMIKL